MVIVGGEEPKMSEAARPLDIHDFCKSIIGEVYLTFGPLLGICFWREGLEAALGPELGG